MFRIMTVVSSFMVIFTSFSSYAEPQYWLAKKGATEYMIIGSVHVGDKSMYPLPKALTEYLEQSSGLIIEADVRNTSDSAYPPVSTRTKDVLDKLQRQHLIDIARDLGIAEAQLLNAPPWNTALMIQLGLVNKLGYVADEGVDMHLISLAEKENIPIVSLESVQFQIDLITGQPDEGKEMLLSSINEYDAGEELVECLIESWKNGDGSMLEEASLTDKATEDFNEAFLYARNRDWAKKLDTGSILPQKQALYTVVVGSLHLVGKDNLIDLLAKRGFEITPLGDIRKAKCDI
ncbi:TraB/GumN family protein [Vibrio sp. YIC-376]|uniref:TraB/GumN family protein n=1 Tax=Vibrio sp. YIC-376 TaxID=3136162 RepID=UPI00402AD817